MQQPNDIKRPNPTKYKRRVRPLYNSGFGQKARAVITRMFIDAGKMPPNLPIPRPARKEKRT